MTHYVGLDVGYGYTKIATRSLTRYFLSLIGPAVDVKFHNEMASNSVGLDMRWGKTHRFVGELARRQSPFTVSPRARERDPLILRLLTLAALHEIDADGNIAMVTGLPVDWYRDREDLVTTLRDDYVFTVGQQERRVSIDQVLVVPQPFGSFFCTILTPEGILADPHNYRRQKVAILDVGTHTTDYALSDSLSYIEPRSGSVPVATARVHELLQRAIIEEYDVELPDHEIEQLARRGEIVLYGEPQDIRPLVEAAVDAVWDEIQGKATTLWGKAETFAAVLVTGGGGPLFYNRIQAIYPHARLINKPQVANAQGFYRYALRKFGA